MANRRHIGADHPERAISEKEVDEVLANPDRSRCICLTGRRTDTHPRASRIQADHQEADLIKTKASRRPFSDPFDELSDEAFEREVLEALEHGTTKISLRVPNDLLARTRRAAGRRGVPYQSLIKVLIDQGVSRLERVPAQPKTDAIRRRTRIHRRGNPKG